MNAPSPTPPSKARTNGRSATAWRRRLPWIGGAVLLALIVWGLWPKALPVETAVVARGALAVTVDEEGMTRVKNRYVVSAPIAGQLRRIEWKAGATIEAGKTVLATLETAGADFLDARSLAQAEARVQAATASREAALAQQTRAAAAEKMYTTDFERVQKLADKKVLSPQEFDMAQMRATTAQQDTRAADFAVRVAEYELQQAQALLTRGQGPHAAEPLVLTSPVNGRLLRVLQESARVVNAGFPLMEIGDPTDIEARIEVLSRDAVLIKPGARVSLEQWGGAEPLAARVRWVEPSAFTKVSALGVEEQRVYVVVDFTDPLEKRPTLGDNYRVEARIVTWEANNLLTAPAGALFQRNGTWQCFVDDGGRARLRMIKVGHGNGIATEIVDGLSEGDRVIVYPGDKIADGVRVAAVTIGQR